MRTAQRDSELAAQSYASGLWTRETLADALAAAARDTPRREALVDGQVRLDCANLHTRARQLAGAMSARMPAGSVVSFMLPNWHEAAIVYHAATVAGMVVNPILPSLRDHELAFILADAAVRMIFIPAEFGGHDYASMLQRVTATMPSPPIVAVVRGEPQPGQLTFGTLDTLVFTPPELDPDAVKMILYTSGTTGRPKGVLHSHNSIHALIRQLSEHWRVGPGSVSLVPSPIAHIGGSIYAFEFPILLGTTAVLMDRWEPDAAVALMTAEGCTHMAGATPFLQHLLGAAERAGTRLPDLKVFICGGASVPPALIRSAANYFEHAVVTRVYGSTEVPVMTVGAPDDPGHAAETDGRPGIADVIIADGEIRARGPQMLLGYLHPDDEADAFDANGYFRTGDLGHWVDHHFLVVTGRAKDIVIRNGENIAPKEVEDVLLGHPDIQEIAIVGLPDARTGERACAVVVTEREPGLGVADLRDFLQATGIAKFKWPEQVVVWESLPKNDAGKVLKHQIRARLVEADG
ncbi:AMP-binding protein [Mycolicibacterium sarraceniae]|uniref:Long-chain-fatty-acid--CoA ligase FadD13 n=1 Tax=Mycolicibacterium sarraceniae TaxID=1534348 RepID=A0A7I7SWV5_9MYCO|nr:AMP-binding protein [Mycolicibacterium sarraceniae]BBY60699.1 cyclohexanecarboxylate-CoA ligase [Mycolicibacterium sarraceniae]